MAIDIGGGATDRGSNTDIAGETHVDLNNPANDTGTIDTFELWCVVAMTACKMGTFTNDGDYKFTNRDGETLGEVSTGSKQTFSGLNCNVVTDDVIGIYDPSGRMEADPTGGLGVYDKAGDQFGAGQQTYSLVSSGMVHSLYGTGTEAAPEGHPYISRVQGVQGMRSWGGI